MTQGKPSGVAAAQATATDIGRLAELESRPAAWATFYPNGSTASVYTGGQAYVYDECHRIELSEPQLQTLRDSRWIPVGERLPEHGDAIWVYDGKDVFMGEYSQGSGFQSYGASMDREGLNSETLHGVTHWMEIDEPKPPEVK